MIPLCKNCGHGANEHEGSDREPCHRFGCSCQNYEAPNVTPLRGKDHPSNLSTRCSFCGHNKLAHIDTEKPDGVGECHHGSGCQCPQFEVMTVGGRVAEVLNQELKRTGFVNADVSVDTDKDLTFDEIIEKVNNAEWTTNRGRRAMGVEEIPMPDTTETTQITAERFTEIIQEQIKRSTDLLIDKAKEYASDTDRMHNFRVAAALQGITPEQALGGFLAKHTVSVFDMIQSGKTYDLEKWDEKITDHINYLLILRALVEERA